MSEAPVVVRRVIVPDDIAAPDAADFIAMAELRNDVARERTGHDLLAYAPAELLPGWQNQEDSAGEAWLVFRGEEAIARFYIERPMEDGSEVADMGLDVRAAHWEPGLVDEGFRFVEEAARTHGRRILQTWTFHRPDDDLPALASPTGFGSIPRDDYAEAFLAHGYALEQVERNSALDLRGGGATIERLHAEALAAASDRYRLVSWTLPTPDHLVPGYAWLMSRMSTDAPSAGMVWDEETWDAARLRRYEKEVLDGGRFGHIVAAEHIDSGTLVAFNELFVDGDRAGVTEQNATLVLREHRGHRLGMLVKAANLLAWRELVPDSAQVTTFNAEENRPMLDINEALGFVAVSYAGAWKKTLDA
ncbi:UNVERIFIED_CONTAM: GNAT family N-acetyltransferase [Microbacterium sp. SLM126]